MFRKKLISAATIAAMMSAVPVFAAPIATTDAGQGTIEFTGSVIDAPCSIVPNDQNIKVNLGQVSLKTLDAADKYSSAVPVTINLTGCSFDAPANGGTTVQYSKVAVTFPGTNTPASGDATKGQIANDAPDAAENVSIQLLKGDAATPVDLTKLSPTTGDIQLDTTSVSSKLQFYARMITVGGAAEAGGVHAQVTYKLHYF